MTNSKITTKQIWAMLKTIPDPELGISVVDLGLIYGVDIDKTGNVKIKMTLTTMGCPLFELMENPIREKIGKLKGVKKISIDLTFDPPWNVDLMSEEAKVKMGFI